MSDQTRRATLAITLSDLDRLLDLPDGVEITSVSRVGRLNMLAIEVRGEPLRLVRDDAEPPMVPVEVTTYDSPHGVQPYADYTLPLAGAEETS